MPEPAGGCTDTCCACVIDITPTVTPNWTGNLEMSSYAGSQGEAGGCAMMSRSDVFMQYHVCEDAKMTKGIVNGMTGATRTALPLVSKMTCTIGTGTEDEETRRSAGEE